MTKNAPPAVTTKSAYVTPALRKGAKLTQIAAATSKKDQLCWIARAAFGEEDFRWMIFREWLLADAPSWFRALYIRHGERIGAWLAEKPRARALVRRAMGVAIRRKLGFG